MFEDKLISADSHVDEPLELWQERLPVHLRHKAPHIEVRDGKRLMIQDGMRPKKMTMGSDEKTDEDKLREQGRLQGWDVGYRLNAQDIDGVGAEVVYPGTFGLEMACSPDAEFQGEVARVYNDWTTELFGEPKGPVRHGSFDPCHRRSLGVPGDAPGGGAGDGVVLPAERRGPAL